MTSCIRLVEEPGVEEREGLSPRDLEIDTEGFFLYSASYQVVMKAEKQKNESNKPIRQVTLITCEVILEKGG